MPVFDIKKTVQSSIKVVDKSISTVDKIKSTGSDIKQSAQTSVYAKESTVDEYAADRINDINDQVIHLGERAVKNTGSQVKKQGVKGVDAIKNQRAKSKVKKAEQPKQDKKTKDKKKDSPKNEAKSDIKKVKPDKPKAFDSDVKVPKTSKEKYSYIKTTERASAKTAEKAEQASVKAGRKAAQKTAQATYKAEETARKSADTVIRGTKKAADATVKAAHAAVAAVKSLGAAIGAGGVTAVIVVVIICVIGLVAGSAYGIFFSGESFDESGMSMRTVVLDINMEYQNELEKIQKSKAHDELEMKGSMAVWPEVLSVYAVKTNMDETNPQEVATMDDNKKKLLSDIFWEMNEISHLSKTEMKNTIVETDDGYGNIVQTIKPEKKTTLYIIVTHKTAKEMALKYKFDEEQNKMLNELLKDSNSSLWSDVLYGVSCKDEKIVNVALSQVGNVGGKPYWSWYGFHSRVEWCACFVSWCANKCGYIESGIIPKYASCANGMNWFKERGQWTARTPNPEPGMIIFFDWNNKGGKGNQDGIPDHTGIVQKVENGKVYTVEGNAGDSCRVNSYNVNHYEILGYGVPAY